MGAESSQMEQGESTTCDEMKRTDPFIVYT